MNGKCYCGAPHCIGTLFPRIIRDDPESSDEGGGEIQDKEHNEGDEETGSNEMADEA